jgi:hypothetical protein
MKQILNFTLPPIGGPHASACESFRLDVGRPDHLAPLLGLVSDELAEIGRSMLSPFPRRAVRCDFAFAALARSLE